MDGRSERVMRSRAKTDSGSATLDYSGLWPLDESVVFLNHGSFGACPIEILERQRQLREEMERDPVAFLWRELPARLGGALDELGRFIGAQGEDLAFVANATVGVNAVARSIALSAGDELLTTNHAYGACRKTLEFVARRSGASVVEARVPFPVDHPNQIVEAIIRKVTPRTKLALIDHVTSPTALVLPIRQIVNELQERGVDVLVDGAHALGMVPLALDELGAAYYTANAHKWLCAPKGAAFLHVRHDRQHLIHPTTISHGFDPTGAGARFRQEFDWVGTVDPTPWLCVPHCIDYLGSIMEGGWRAIMDHNHALTLRARSIFSEVLNVSEPCPGEMIGSMASLFLPVPERGAPAERLDHESLMHWCRDRGVSTWFYPWDCASGKLVRVSMQLYNTQEHVRRLAELIRESLSAG